MKKVKKLLAILLAVFMTVSVLSACNIANESAEKGSQGADEGTAKNELEKVTISIQTASNGLPFYVAKQEGLFEKAGIDPELLVYTGGAPQIEALATDAWSVGACGIPPTINAMMTMNLHVVGTCMSDDKMVDIFVRADSPIALSGKGNIDGYPELYGTTEDWKGINVLGPLGTTGHYALVCAIDALGLSGEDVSVTNMAVPAAATAFKAGEGDAVIQWLALSAAAEKEGWVKAATSYDVGSDAPSVLIASDRAVNEDPELVKAIVGVYYEATKWINANPDKALDYYLELLTDNGVTNTREECKAVLDAIPYHTVEEVQEYMAQDASGESKIRNSFIAIMEYFKNQGTYSDAEVENFKSISSNLMTSDYVSGLSN